MSTPRAEITYTDELLADGTVYRRYSDGRQEWRTRTAEGHAIWRDDRGESGVDEPLDRRIVKRTLADGRVFYGREHGYGRTLWSDGVLTVNRSKFGGRLGTAVASLAGAAMIGGLVDPPDFLTPEAEEALRADAMPSGGGGSGGGDAYSAWGDGGDFGDDGGDFG